MTLSEESMERISLLCEVAQSQGSLITLNELVTLLPDRTSEGEIAQAISSVPTLRSQFITKAGYITNRQQDLERESAVAAEERNRKRARNNLKFASDFTRYLHNNPFKLVSVSGSTSYRSASRSEDLDFFCVSPASKMWLSLAQALLMAKVYGLLRKEGPQICFSYIMGEDLAQSTFAHSRGALFARDALETQVIRGRGTYQRLLANAKWIERYYPNAYPAMARQVWQGVDPIENPSALDKVLNGFLYFTVGRYIKLKAKLLNRKITHEARSEKAFRVIASDSHLVYESERYANLEKEYSRIAEGPPNLKD